MRLMQLQYCCVQSVDDAVDEVVLMVGYLETLEEKEQKNQ